MPGILPMKMIRVGQSSQSRIAQACDRCRSKKIRCDGIRPCCSQCENVGFECKTSDKLSRRAFPRGYTESLEDRVRSLEAEVRDLKLLLDEKDEKIDMLSRIHNFSPQSRKNSLSPNAALQVKAETEPPSRENVILVEIPAPVQPLTSSTGTSTTAALIEAFEEKVHESGHTCPLISPSSLLKTTHIAAKASTAASPTRALSTPPRLLSDQYINLYFQEWQPLLPILHRPTFLRTYEQYLTDPDAQFWQSSRHGAAQLFLIFEIAAHSSSSKARPSTTSYELQWRKALSSVSSTPSVATIQCHLLAQLIYLLKADYPHLLRHRAYAVSMIHQMSFHQGYKCHSLPAFEAETSKKLFWCQYVLDKFASAVTGTPQMLHEADITTEFPADVDDENISVQGFSPALPGELTKISSALALFRVAQILGRTLEHLYPAKASYQLPLTKLHSLSDELDQWQEELPDHLRLRFCNDKPATNLISCRSPLLSLAYFYTRSLIHRPLLCYGTGNAASAATIVLAAAAKHELQILDLLDERSMNYTFPLSKQDVLLNAGFSILWQSLGLEDESKLVKDNQKSLSLLLTKITKENQFVATEFHKIATTFVTLQDARILRPSHIDIDNATARMLSSMPAPIDKQQKSTRKQLHAIASRLTSMNGKNKIEEGSRRNTFSQPGIYQSLSPHPRANSTVSLSSTRSAPAVSLPTPPANLPALNRALDNHNASAINLDYFPFSNETSLATQISSTTMLPPRKSPQSSQCNQNWDQNIHTTDPNTPDLFNTVSPTALNQMTSGEGSNSDWMNDIWQISAFDLAPKPNVPQSLLSFSEESLTSAEELIFSAPSSHKGSMSTNDSVEAGSGSVPVEETFKGITIPVDDEFDFHEIVD